MAAFNPVHTASTADLKTLTSPSALPLDPSIWLAGSSAAMAQLRGQLRRVAPYFRTALLTGERGCGEVIAARILHQMSSLHDRPFLELTPSAAELRFGGSGLPSGPLDGMLYLPQPERLPRSTQVLLLRLLRERGPQAPRMVAYAERGLRSLVSSGSFSADLADALGALRVTLPALRDRAEDIPALLTHMLQSISEKKSMPAPELAPNLMEAAMRLPWPGNLVQLQAAAVGLCVRSGTSSLQAADLISVLSTIPDAQPRERHGSCMVRLDDVIQEHIRSVLSACNGNKLRTAEVLGISRSTLYRMLDAQTSSQPLAASSHDLRMAG
jgi:DNA-binding NtrC family response regulator